jgi:hypothetical protein
MSDEELARGLTVHGIAADFAFALVFVLAQARTGKVAASTYTSLTKGSAGRSQKWQACAARIIGFSALG